VSRILDRDRTALVVVDVQEGFREAVGEFDEVARNAGLLVQGARILGVPVLVTEQYPRGLGETVPEVAEHLDGVPRLEKVEFDATEVEGFDLGGRDQALLCGIEAHVCVAQTALELLGLGFCVQVPADAVGSRHKIDWEFALRRLEHAGAILSTTEAVLFEWTECSDRPEFKAISALVKEADRLKLAPNH
jgi:nicotinamidase-related amidase